jgi:hypothetical protein
MLRKFLFLLTLTLTACSTVAPITPTSTTTPSFTPTIQPLDTITPAPSITATPSVPPNILKLQPFPITTNLPSDLDLGGTLVIEESQAVPKLFRFIPQIKLEDIHGMPAIPGTTITCPSPSPDGKWLACQYFSNDNRSWLIIKSADGKQSKKIELDPSLLLSMDWLDNQHMIGTILRREDQFAASTFILNPFTGEQTQLDSNYPDLAPFTDGPPGTMAFGGSDVVYSPFLKFVVYRSFVEKQEHLMIWNLETKSLLTKIKNITDFDWDYPYWSPNGEKLAIAMGTKTYQANDALFPSEEWFLVNEEGQVEQLTHFGDYFTQVSISYRAANWSPDGKKLAFWLETIPSLCYSPGQHLAILDVMTKQVTNTCLRGGKSRDSIAHPIWSLNSRYINILDVYDNDLTRYFLVDTERNTAFEITDYIPYLNFPSGWLAIP